MNGVSPFFINPAKIPDNYITRTAQIDSILNAFTNKTGEYGKYIVGVRGSGKTVLMNYVCDRLSEMDFITIRINPLIDMYDSAIDGLINNITSQKILLSTKINFGISIGGIAASIELEKMSVSTKEGILRNMVKELTKKGKKIVFSIDEVHKSDSLSSFAQTVQTMIGYDKSDIYILMTGLPENVKKVKSDNKSSFLARIMDVKTEPLSDISVQNSYKRIFDISREEASEITSFVKGYSYGYQLLGHILWEQDKTKIDDEVLDAYDEILFTSQYDLIWDTLTDTEKKIFVAISKSKNYKTDEIITISGIDGNTFNQYRRQLSEKMLIDTKRRGYNTFILPRFKEYIEYQTQYM